MIYPNIYRPYILPKYKSVTIPKKKAKEHSNAKTSVNSHDKNVHDS